MVFFFNVPQVTNRSESPVGESGIFTAKPVHIREDLSISKSTYRSSAEDLSSVHLLHNNDCSLTLSEDSDTTRVYDLNKRETSLLRTDIIKTSRFAAPPNIAATPPSSPVEGTLESHYASPINRQLDDNIAFQQLSQIKRAIEERSASTSPVPAPLSPVLHKWFGLPEPTKSPSPVNHTVPPRAKRIASFPFRKMEDEAAVTSELLAHVPFIAPPAIPIAVAEATDFKEEAAIVTVISSTENDISGPGVIEEEVPEQFVSIYRMSFR